ncbi:coiled-coil domain-containing protein [Wolbachia endosymbiont of Diaphorina citri]|jgi:Chromosome segregation ATPases|uniref:hypothetical protein n=1 Tax=Wolbachia endosymbiont of Diaphorina citri TaxID=116598 RepID=UPI0002FCEC3A|nr:hypothetical protein [Wolbachia endosymbiont of Diaphorina citri]
MLNANNKVNYETSIKQKEKKYSLSTVLAWLYLKTIGRILPRRWNKWAENILHYNIADNGVQTDDLLNSDREKELKDEIKRLEEKLKEGSKKEENQSNLNQELTKKEKEITELKEQVKLLEEEKEGKISSLTELNKVLEQEKKEMDDENNAQQRTISNQDKRIKEQDTLITSLTDKNKDINETVKEDNESLRAQNTDLESEINELKEKAKKKNTEVENLKQQLEQNKSDSSNKLSAAKKEKKELENEVTKLQEQAKEKGAEVENLKQQLEKEKDELKDSISKLNTAEKNKKDLEGEVKELKEKLQILEKNSAEIEKQKADLEGKLKSSQEENKKLQEQVQTLEKGKEWESAGIDDSLKQTSAKKEKQIEQLQEERKQAEYQAKADITKLQEEKRGLLVKIDSLKENLSVAQEQLQKQLKLNNQELLELKKEKRNVDTKLEDMDKKTKEVDAISIASTTKKTLFHSMKSSFSNGSYDLFNNKKLKEFLSHKNRELKKGFPELEGKHFCHNVLGETIKSLSNQSDGKFESNKLLELLKNNLKKLASEIIEAEVKGVVKKYCNIGNIDKELRDGVLKDKLLLSIKKCMKNLSWDEEAANAITDSVLNNFHSKDNSNLQEIVSEELIKGRMEFFSSNIELLQLASSIRDKFLSPDQRMCNKTQGRVNEYQLTDKAKKEYELTPNSSISYTTEDVQKSVSNRIFNSTQSLIY